MGGRAPGLWAQEQWVEAAARGLKKVDVRGLVAFEVPAAKVTAPGTQGQGWGCECTGGGLGLISHSCCNTLAHTCMVYYSTLRCLSVLEAGSLKSGLVPLRAVMGGSFGSLSPQLVSLHLTFPLGLTLSKFPLFIRTPVILDWGPSQ